MLNYGKRYYCCLPRFRKFETKDFYRLNGKTIEILTKALTTGHEVVRFK